MTRSKALRGRTAPRWAEVAAVGGFYDQSHLVHELRALCGLTPRLLLERAASGSSKTDGDAAATVARTGALP